MLSFLDYIRQFPEVLQMVGVLGFVLYVGGFFLIQNGSVCGNGIMYPLSKVIAATCVLISLTSAFNLASFLIQCSYIAIGLYGVGKRLRKKQTGGYPNSPAAPATDLSGDQILAAPMSQHP